MNLKTWPRVIKLDFWLDESAGIAADSAMMSDKFIQR